MRNGINKVTLVGNVGDDPRVSEKEGEAFVAHFPLATSERYKDKNGEEVDKTEWHRVTVWNKQAEVIKKYLKKGDPLYVEGKITTSSYEDKEGVKRYSTDIICNNFLFLSTANGANKK